MTDHETLAELVRNACFAADRTAMLPWRTDAARTKAIIQEALMLLIGNRLITVVSRDTWPSYIVLDPPYDRNPFEMKS
jgi:hypothetical protein